MQVLRVHHYGETAEEDRRITIAPAQVSVIAAEVDDVQLQGRSVRKTTILMSDGASIDVNVNHADLDLLETTVGAFYIGD